MKTFLNIEEANKEIKRLKRKLCCCPNNCPLSERTYYGDSMVDNDPVQIQVMLNNIQIYGASAISPITAIGNANAALLGLATFTLDGSLINGGRIKMVTNICAEFELVAIIDNG